MFVCSQVDPADDNDSIVTNLLLQSQVACQKIKSYNLLMDEINLKGSYSLYGVSQGAVIARYIAQVCLREIHIHSFVSLCGPINGIDHIPYCKNNAWYCEVGQ